MIAALANPSSTVRNTWIAAVITLLVVVLYRIIALEIAGPVMDEGVLLLYPEMILDGKVPYRDFETFYGPLNLWVLAGAYSVFGVHIVVERAVALVMLLTMMLGIFKLSRRGGLVTAISAVFLAAVCTQIMELIAFAWLGGVMCLVWSLILLAKPGRMAIRGAGLLAAGALLYRPDLGPALLAFIPMLWRLPKPARWNFALGLGLGLVPLAVLTLVAGIRPVFENLFLYPVIYSNPGRKLPLAGAPPWVQAIFWAHITSCILNLLAGVKSWMRQPKVVEHALHLSVAILGGLISHQALQRADDVHVCMTAFLSISLVPWSLVTLLRRGEETRKWHGALASAVAIALLMTVAFRPFRSFYEHGRLALHGNDLVSISVKNGDRAYPVASLQLFQPLDRIVSFLEAHSTPGERLFVGPADLRRTNYSESYLYHLLPKLKPATYFLEMNPLSANRPDSRLASDVASADWLVLSNRFDDWPENNASAKFGSDAPNEVIRRQFTTVLVRPPFIVLRRSSAMQSGAAPIAAK